jgi:hypothetical protein
MTNLNKLIERRQGEVVKRIVDEFKTEELVLDSDKHYYIRGTTEDLESAVRLALEEERKQALLDLQAGLPGDARSEDRPGAEMEGWDTSLQTVRAQINDLLGKIE